MTPEEHYKEVVKLDMDKFDKKMPKFDYYDLLDFADSYYKKQLTLTDVGNCPFEAYAVFCIECDRKGIKPIKYKDYLNLV